MAQRVIIPRLGQTMTEGIVTQWFKKDGDTVAVDDDIYELEYDKSTADVQAKKAGVLRILVEEGATVPLGEAVAIILENGETLEQVLSQKTYEVASSAKSDVPVKSVQQTAKPQAKTERVSASPMVKRLAAEHGIELLTLTPSAPNGRLSKADVERYLEERSKAPVSTAPEPATAESVRSSPMAKKIAKELGVDINAVTAADGRSITKDDVINFAEANSGRESKDRETYKPRESRRELLRGMRKIISKRMAHSYFTYPTVTLTTDADMSELMRFRAKYNKEHMDEQNNADIKLSVTDIILAAAAKALRENEIINAYIDGDEIVYQEDINIGMAVGLENGLVVPVLRNTDKLTFEALSKQTKRLAEAAKKGTISADEMKGGTFTVTNLGTAGIDSFNPIINFPESAILGVGRTIEKPVVLNGEIIIRPKAVLSLTHDHRLIDGIPASKFLKAVVNYIENPRLITN